METGTYTNTVQPFALDRFFIRLVYFARRGSLLGKAVKHLLRLVGVDIPPQVVIGPGLKLPHVGAGHTVHWNTELGARVVLLGGAVIGRADLWGPIEPPPRFEIGDDVIVGANAVILGRAGQTLTVGPGAVVAAGAVLSTDVPAGEIWAGQPARKVGARPLG